MVEILSASDDSSPVVFIPPRNILTGKLQDKIARRKRDGHQSVILADMMATIRENNRSEHTDRKPTYKKAVPYNREITDALCTDADRASVQGFITREITRWREELGPFINRLCQLPPSSHKLSDEHVYAVTKTLSAKGRRARMWTEDFNALLQMNPALKDLIKELQVTCAAIPAVDQRA
ncbi:hypothetical protein N7468_006499 [Penicillium chermesinum]|uniref:Uncharacterized protein n=1 Tax=Penicillium chermesinum TaxID=63820 RepID=A0A9W9TJW7_9EURO|nr:uncharacterized protein N7468_006499 [Penicillium chermesinum]KAJ5225274.1 hypothetical protein N7468_006499 [Penicillium chermesinum]